MTYDPDDKFALFSTEASDTSVQTCEWPECILAGEHRAPKSRDQIREYRWFCLEHVRIYNRSWNYYEGMSDEQVDKLVRSDTTWNRPTWPMGDHRRDTSEDDQNTPFGPETVGTGFENVGDPFGFFTQETAFKKSADRAPKTSLSAAERRALSLLDLDVSVTVTELKARYKLLVKRYHPDVTGGNKKLEERFKQINEAYETIMTTLAAD
jgi:hypothetical protein